ncbi:HTH-type transcriptional regulator EutR [Salmonella enterica]|nr:HTH-type transcriptional regulator EutR [Salmonella enterica subsp. enterica serovar Eastbourne]EFR4407533.1 HTH-type transcriptional regulator EutR [Salmonella enterica]
MSAKKIDLHHLYEIKIPDSEGQVTVDKYKPVANLNHVQCKKSDDIYQHACNFTAWQNLYDQLKPGGFKGQLIEGWIEGVQFFYEYTSVAVRQSCIVWPHSIWVGIPMLPFAPDSYIGAERIAAHNTIALREGGNEFELNTPENYHILGVVVDTEIFVHYIESLHGDHFGLFSKLLTNLTLHVSLQQKKYTVAQIQNALCQVASQPGLSTNRVALKMLREDLLDNIAHLIFSAGERYIKPHSVRERYQRIVSRAREYILSHPGEAISIVDLCNFLHVSRRTLQNCFQRITGITPCAYLKCIRLNAVRRELESSYSGYKTVQDAAMAWGFWHLGQFAHDYKILFNELPYFTLTNRQLQFN